MDSSDDDVERLKAWLRENGSALLLAVVIGLALAYAIRFWRAHEETHAENAALLYGQALGWASEGNASALEAAAGKLEKDYAGTPYAAVAALLWAKQAYTAHDLATANRQLHWAASHARQSAVKATAELRLARVLLDQKQAGAALAAIAGTPPPGFAGAFDEARGDIEVQLGQTANAAKSYAQALAHTPANSSYRSILEMKLEDTGGQPA